MRPTLREVFDQLVREGHFAAEDERRVAEQLAAQRNGTPWFVKALMGVGAWVATGLFLTFLALAGAFDNEGVVLVLGLVLVGGALLVRKAWEAAMATQLALSLSLVGQAMLAIGIAEVTDSLEAAALALLLLSAGLIAVFPDPVHRFLSTLAAAGSLLFFLFALEEHLAPAAGYALIAGGMVAWWLRPAQLTGLFAELRGPVGHGLTVATLVAILPDSIGLRPGNDAVAGAAILTVAVLWVEWQLLREARGRIDGTAALALGLTLLIGVATVRVPGLQASLAVLLLAQHRREPLLFGQGVLALVFFLSRYYYALELSLLHKSLLLVVSGAVLLASWRYLLPKAAQEVGR